MPKYLFRKLVRDKLPDLYIQRGQKPTLKQLRGDELWRALKAKLFEEADELPSDMADKATVTAELADLLRVIKDAATLAGVSMTEIEDADALKTAKSGGFLDGVYVETQELAEDDPLNAYFRKEPARFPELGLHSFSVDSLVELSDTLGEMGNVDRATLLPGGRHETDSHHSFSLALIAYDICHMYCPELDADKVVRYALVHDLLEIITGDQDTLMLDEAGLHAKHIEEQRAAAKLHKLLAKHPALLEAYEAYERLDSPEAATVYVLDKCSTTWTHFWDAGADIHSKMSKPKELDEHHDRQLTKIHTRLQAEPPQVIYDIYEASHQAMVQELF